MELTQETAIVRDVKDGRAYLDLNHSSSCNSCSSKKGCSSFAFFDIKTVPYLEVSEQFNLKVGDQVLVGMPGNKILLATFLMYLIPLLALIISAILGFVVFGEIGSMIAGFSGFTLSLLGVKKLLQKGEIGKQFEPVVINKVFPLETVNN